MLRAMSMSDHIGHEAVREALIAANARETVHHAYLFAGARGVGKYHLALPLMEETLAAKRRICSRRARCSSFSKLYEGMGSGV